MRAATAVVALLALSTAHVQAQTYHLQDHQYFRTMIADIRRPHNHIGLYNADPVRYTNPKQDAAKSHLFWDVAFGDQFPLLGFSYSARDDEEEFKKRGIDFFPEPNVHMLLDFGAESNAVINFPADEPVKEIDYVLYRPAQAFDIIESRVVDEPMASDHRPVLRSWWSAEPDLVRWAGPPC